MSTTPYTLLYEFELGTKVWRYTANAEDVIDPLGRVWEAAVISDDGIAVSGEAASDSLSITASADIVPARLYMFSPPSRVMDVRILEAALPVRVDEGYDEGVDATAEPRLIPVTNVQFAYVGEVSQCGFPQPGTAIFTCETISASMQQEGLSLGWQRQCPYVIYNCGADKAANALPRQIIDLTSATITVSPSVSVDLSGGLLEYVDPIKGEESLTIESGGPGSIITIFGGTAGLYLGQQVTLYRGCAQTYDACVSFGNLPNHGGIKHLPGKSPFDGVDSPVF